MFFLPSHFWEFGCFGFLRECIAIRKKEKKIGEWNLVIKKSSFTFGLISKFLKSVVFVRDHGWVIHA